MITRRPSPIGPRGRAGGNGTHRPRRHRPRRHEAGELRKDHVSATEYGNGCSFPGPNVLFDQSPPLVDPSPWAAPWVFVVNFRPVCDMHDAGYDGGIVFDPISGGYVDTRALSRRTIDDRFYDDLINSLQRADRLERAGGPRPVLHDRRHLLRRRTRRRLGPLRRRPCGPRSPAIGDSSEQLARGPSGRDLRH